MNGQLLRGKHAVITAGAHGLGFAVAKLFAEHGAVVAICGRDPSGVHSGELLAQISPGSFFLPCDLQDQAAVAQFGQAVLDRLGHVDILANCVGINGVREPVCDISFEHYDFVQDVNIKASLTLLRTFIPTMIEKGIPGSIINISSIHSVAPSAIMGSYASSKGGINAISRVLATEVGKYGIRSNTICPGWIATTDLFKDLDQLESREAQHAYLEQLDGAQPCLCPARAEDIARHALFFASDLSSYITGATIMADGASSLQTHYADFEEPENAYEQRCAFYDTILDSSYTKR